VSFKDGKFGRLTIRKAITDDIFECDCACGNLLHVWRSLLISSVQRDCGMCRRKRNGGKGIQLISVHGHRRAFTRRDGSKGTFNTSEFNSWSNMIARCQNKHHHAYENYGGRGIRVCNRWRAYGGYGLLNFLKDLGPRPGGLTLDRINPQGHYEPTNCRWATPKVQANNQTRWIWQHCTPPPGEHIREMEKRIAEYDAETNPF
jgi:hypothetical protein